MSTRSFVYVKIKEEDKGTTKKADLIKVGLLDGDTLFALFMDVGFMWLLALPLGWLAVLVWHLPFWAVYLCILSEPVCKSIIGIYRLFSNKWLRKL